MLVEELMATDVVTTTPEATVKDVDALFTLNAISGAPVLENGDLIGLVSQSDVIALLYDQQIASTEVSYYSLSPCLFPLPPASVLYKERAKIGDRMVNTTVREIMTPIPITVAPDDHIRDAAQRMIDAQIHRVLVTRDSALVGILTTLDLAGLVATDF